MDHALGESAARAFDFTNEPARVAASVKSAGGGRVRRNEVDLWSFESLSARPSAGPTSFLPRLPERDCRIWLARAAHDRFRSSGGADFVLHLARGIRRMVGRNRRARRRDRMA